MILKAGIDASVQFKRKSQEQPEKRNKKVFCLLRAFVTFLFEFTQKAQTQIHLNRFPHFLRTNVRAREVCCCFTGPCLRSSLLRILNHSQILPETFQRVDLFFLFALSHPSFNLPHDGDNNPCTRSRGDQHLMARSLSFDNKPWSWSNCSRDKLTNFLE